MVCIDLTDLPFALFSERGHEGRLYYFSFSHPFLLVSIVFGRFCLVIAACFGCGCGRLYTGDFLPETTPVGLFFPEASREGVLPFLAVDFLAALFIFFLSFKAGFFDADSFVRPLAARLLFFRLFQPALFEPHRHQRRPPALTAFRFAVVVSATVLRSL